MMKAKGMVLFVSIMLIGVVYAGFKIADNADSITPQQALTELIEGNQRFIKENQVERDLIKKRQMTAREGQFPHSIILNCIDSRSIAQLVFDQSIGNIFTSSIAGNVADVDVIAGMEFAVLNAGSKLIVVMGHTRCGAVQAACKNVGTSNIRELTAKIMPAVKTVGKTDCDNYETVDAIAKQNVLNMMENIVQKSPKINELLKDKKIALVGAMHDLKTGKVEFFDRNGQPIKQ